MTKYIPENAKEIKKDGLNAVAYTYEKDNGTLCAIGYSGRRNKPDFHYRYGNEQKRTESIEAFFKRLEARANYKIEQDKRQKELKSEFLSKLEVGSILNTCWGYEQTNIEWYQITKIKGSAVYLRRIAANLTPAGFMSADTTPIKDKFIGEEIKRIVRSTGIRIETDLPPKYEPNTKRLPA